jgi:hypothetical protein
MYAREASQSKVASRNRFDVSSFRRQRKRHWNGSYRPAASSGALIRQAEMRFLLGMRPQEVLEAIIASSSHHHRIVPSSIHRCLPSLQAMQANSLHHHLIPHISHIHRTSLTHLLAHTLPHFLPKNRILYYISNVENVYERNAVADFVAVPVYRCGSGQDEVQKVF